MTPVDIRWMLRHDFADVLRIESESFPRPWTEDEFLKCLRQRNCIGMVAEVDEQVIGYMVYGLHKEAIELFNFAVDPKCRRMGYGRQMADKIKSKLSSHRRREVILVVRESNLPAQLFWRSMRFTAMEVMRNYYVNGEDGYLMAYSIQESQVWQEEESVKT